MDHQIDQQDTQNGDTSIVGSLLHWAIDQGVGLDGINPIETAHCGFAMMATRNLKKGDVIMTVPIQTIRSLDTVSKTISTRLAEHASIHSLLAADILLHPPGATHWGKLVPKLADFEQQMPYFWPTELQELLPTEAKGLLAKQKMMFGRDWDQFKIGFPSTSMRDYLYAWFLVGTRSFYYETAQTLKYPWHDRLALLPVADLFNHAASGCYVSYSPSGSYTITTDRHYAKGDEICISYGCHSNDFLLAEYGFVLPDNPSDNVCLNDVIHPKLSEQQRTVLQENEDSVNLVLSTQSNPCNRTKMAMRLLLDDAAIQSGDYSRDGLDSHDVMSNTSGFLASLLKEYLNRSETIKKTVMTLEAGTPSQRALLAQRWGQIEAILRQSLM